MHHPVGLENMLPPKFDAYWTHCVKFPSQSPREVIG